MIFKTLKDRFGAVLASVEIIPSHPLHPLYPWAVFVRDYSEEQVVSNLTMAWGNFDIWESGRVMLSFPTILSNLRK